MSSSRDDDKFREYLLGKLTGEAREEFERRLFTDDELFEKLQTAEDDLVDDHLTGDLSEDEIALFETKFLIGSKRERQVRIGKAWRNYAATQRRENPPNPDPQPVSKWRQFFFSHSLKIATVASLILVVGLTVSRIPSFFPSDVEKGLSALDAAYRQERPLQSRISELAYAPFIGTRGSGSTVNEGERDQAELTLRGLVNSKPTPAAHHGLGKVYLAKKEFDKAIDQFGFALKGDPNNAEIYSDLGAAQFENGKLEVEKAKTDSDSAESGKGMEYFAHSLENLNTSLKLDNGRLEALFNRALLYESMGLIPQAEDDWRKYIQSDPNSRWTDDARARLADLEQRRKKASLTREEIFKVFLSQLDAGDDDGVATTVSSYHNRPGNVVVEQLLDSYLDAATSNQKEAANLALQRLSYVGDLQIRKNEDRYFFDLAHFYRSLPPERRDLVIKARELMKSGHAGWGKIDLDENRRLFEEAREIFEQAQDDPEARVAEYWISFCHYRKLDPKQSQQVLDPVLLACEGRRYLWLQSRVLYLRSSIEFNLNNEYSHGVDLGLHSAEIAERTNDSVGQINAESALIEYYRYLAKYPKSLARIQRSLPLITATTLDPIQGTRHYSWVAMAFKTIGFPDAAAVYQREALRFALETGSYVAKAQSYAFMGEIDGKLKNFAEAVKNAQLAFDLAQAHTDGSRMAYSALQLGNIYRDAEQFDKAVGEYTRSIELYKKQLKGLETHLFQAHKGRLLCYIQQQNDPLTQQEISILQDLMKDYRNKILNEDFRNTFFDVEQSVVDAAIDFEYSRMNNRAQAFTYLNDSRARSLLDLLNADKEVKAKVRDPDVKFKTVSEAQPLDAIKQQLPEQTQLLQYAILEDKLLIWVISRNVFEVQMQPISRKELKEKLQRFLNIISRPPKDDEAEELALAKDLYAILIQPVEKLLNKEKLLCIIPDGPLSYLPFAALVSPESNTYLFEERRLMTAPSASVFLSCSENALRNSGPKMERILSVGNPTFDRAAFSEFKDLPEAGREAEEVRAKYKLGVPLTEKQATRNALMSEIERSDVIHLALHSKINEEVPLLSKLLLAKTKTGRSTPEATDESSDSVVYAYEIYNLKLSRSRLVILASCESGAGRYYGGEGVNSLARSFLSAGVPLVVASLWPVESVATKQLMVSFHGHRTQETVPTVEALRSAQSDMLHGSAKNFHRPYYWAAFSVTGGYAPF